MATDFSFSDEEEEKKEVKKEVPGFESPEERTLPETTPPATLEPDEPSTEKRKCILCGTEMKSDLGFMCNDCRDRLLAKTRLGPDSLSQGKPEEKTKTIKF